MKRIVEAVTNCAVHHPRVAEVIGTLTGRDLVQGLGWVPRRVSRVVMGEEPITGADIDAARAATERYVAGAEEGQGRSPRNPSYQIKPRG